MQLALTRQGQKDPVSPSGSVVRWTPATGSTAPRRSVLEWLLEKSWSGKISARFGRLREGNDVIPLRLMLF